MSALHSKAVLQVSGEHETWAELRFGKRQVVSEAAEEGKGQRERGVFTSMPSPGISKSRGQRSVLAGAVVPCLGLGWCISHASRIPSLCSFGLQTAKPPGATFDGKRIASLFQGFAAVVCSNMSVNNW